MVMVEEFENSTKLGHNNAYNIKASASSNCSDQPAHPQSLVRFISILLFV